MAKKPKIIKINLEKLYDIGNLDATSSTVLEYLFKLYDIEGYRIVAMANPDWEWFVLYNKNELQELILEELRKRGVENCHLRCLFREKLVEKIALSAITKYAKRHDYPVVVQLYDGYEYCWAIIMTTWAS
jgi:hypothetical protein